MSVRQTIAKRYWETSSQDAATFGSPTAAGSVILIAVNGHDGGGAPVFTGSDDSANPYTAYSSPDAATRTWFLVAENIPGKASQTVAINPDRNGSSFWQAWEIDNVPASSVLADTPVFWSDADSDPAGSVTSGTPSQGSNLVFVSAGSREAYGTFALTNASSSYTQEHLDVTQSGAQISSNMARKLGNASPQTASWTMNAGAAGSAGIIIFKQSASYSIPPSVGAGLLAGQGLIVGAGIIPGTMIRYT